MAREKLTRAVCDRCKNTIEEVALEAAEPSSSAPLLYLETNEMGENCPSKLQFDDLCAKCKRVVHNLILRVAKIRESGKEEGEGQEGQEETSPEKPSNKKSRKKRTSSKNSKEGDEGTSNPLESL